MCVCARNTYAQKTDTIMHINGNILTGDFKKLSYGVVSWKMDGMGTINFEEVKINKIRSVKQFEIKTQNGDLYFGSMDTTQFNREVKILTEMDSIVLNIDDLVEIHPLKNNFISRISGNASLGANYSKGSNVGSLAFSGNMDYRKEKKYFSLSFDDNNTYQGDSLSSSSSNISIAWQRLVKKRWSSELSVAAGQNTALGSKLKLDLNLMGVYDISYNSWNRFTVGTGVNTTRETSYEATNKTYDLAGIFAMVWKVYKYKTPKVWIDANFTFQPYITTRGRYLTSTSINPKVNLINDNFKIGISFYHNHDSKPPEGATTKSDYGVNLQFSYSFH